MIDFNEIQKLLICAGSNLEKMELGKSNIKNFIDKVLYDSNLLPNDKLNILLDAWEIYKSYEDDVIPFALDNLTQANQLLKNLKK